MRRRLSGKVENQRLLLRVLRSSGQLTSYVIETITKSESWRFWWRWSPGCWSRSMMSTSFTQAALCLTSPKITYNLKLSCKDSLLCEGDLRSKFAFLQRKSLAGPGNNYITSWGWSSNLRENHFLECVEHKLMLWRMKWNLLFLQTWTIPNPPEPSWDSHSQSPSMLCKPIGQYMRMVTRACCREVKIPNQYGGVILWCLFMYTIDSWL